MHRYTQKKVQLRQDVNVTIVAVVIMMPTMIIITRVATKVTDERIHTVNRMTMKVIKVMLKVAARKRIIIDEVLVPPMKIWTIKAGTNRNIRTMKVAIRIKVKDTCAQTFDYFFFSCCCYLAVYSLLGFALFSLSLSVCLSS